MSWQGNRLFSYRFNSRTRVGATYMRFRFLTPNKVSIHAPVWVRLGRRSYSASGILFQFTHPCGCDIPSPLKRYATLRFNSRTRVGATFCQAYGLPLYEVSIHAPVWVRHKIMSIYDDHAKFQFTHPCGCDSSAGERQGFYDVSIHAPVWVRPAPITGVSAIRCFNSRTRVGATVSGPAAHCRRAVSIHAPVWVRLHHRTPVNVFRLFQFTHPCGCDFRNGRMLVYVGSFNSRTRVGATGDKVLVCLRERVSIHAPVWVRLRHGGPHDVRCQFQFTHPCGCDPIVPAASPS